MKLAKRDKRALLIGGSFIGVVLLYIYVISPLVFGNVNGSEELDNKRQLLERYRETIAMETAYRKAIDEMNEKGVDVKKYLLSGSTPALAAAELSNIIGALAEDSNAHINRENVNPAKQVGHHQKISLQLSIITDVIGLKDFLYRIESSGKLLDVESLTVNSRVTRRRRPSRFSSRRGSSSGLSTSTRDVELNITMVVSGYIRATGVDQK